MRTWVAGVIPRLPTTAPKKISHVSPAKIRHLLPAMKQGPSVVVIGAGFGGLAAAIRLQARGFQVTLLEKRDQPGGRAYVYRDAGFAFDGGPTVVTAPFLFEELFALAGKRMSDYLRM